jgi:putative hydrolase of the HAD superfamily
MVEVILFDLDKTLYPCDAGLQEEGDRRITRFLCERLRLDQPAADALRLRLWAEHGTTARGAEVEYAIPQPELYEYAIDSLSPEQFLCADGRLAAMLSGLDCRCCVFTNATPRYAHQVLATLGISAQIERVFDIEWLGWAGKPDRQAYERVIEALGVAPERVLLVEDRAENLVPAAELGMVTVLVGDDVGEADYRIATVTDLPEVLQGLVSGASALGCGRPRP